MTRIKLTGIAAASMLMAATTFAQTQSGAAAPTQPASKAADRITITGCVERADQLNSSGGSSAGASVDSLDFVLIKADVAPAAAPNSAANAATPPSPVGTSGSASTPIYRLAASVDTLNPHVGHKVEVIGTRDAAAPEVTRSADASNPSTATAPRLVVESVKMIADSCNR
jgi:hypothetical protein